jgi:GTP cyclohydrolase I
LSNRSVKRLLNSLDSCITAAYIDAVTLGETTMNLETLRNHSDKILDCEMKDETGLNDFQKLPDQYAQAIDEVGIERFRVPVKYLNTEGNSLSHDAEATMKVNLKAGKTGINMSRFCSILQEELDKPINAAFFAKVLNRFRLELRDFDYEDPIEKAILKLDFNLPLQQKSLKSERYGWQYYKCSLEGISADKDIYKITLNYEYSSTCPCSLSMAKQYEKDFAEGKITQGSGIAVAHSQRSLAIIEVCLDMDTDFKIEDLIALARIAIPTETQSLVKRPDEQAFAILNGDNPMFVEHATRRLSAVLDSEKRIVDWKAKVEHFESLHSHNASATITKKHSKQCH